MIYLMYLKQSNLVHLHLINNWIHSAMALLVKETQAISYFFWITLLFNVELFLLSWISIKIKKKYSNLFS